MRLRSVRLGMVVRQVRGAGRAVLRHVHFGTVLLFEPGAKPGDVGRVVVAWAEDPARPERLPVSYVERVEDHSGQENAV